jgi:hypothetical protein
MARRRRVGLRGSASTFRYPAPSSTQSHAGEPYGEQSVEQPSQLEAGQQCEHRAKRVQPDGITADAPRQHVVLDLLNDQEEEHHQTTVGHGMNSATRTAGTAERIGPNIGTSANSPANTPSTIA